MSNKMSKCGSTPEANQVDEKEYFNSETMLSVPETILELQKMRDDMAGDVILEDVARMLDYVVIELTERCRLAQEVLREAEGVSRKYLN